MTSFPPMIIAQASSPGLQDGDMLEGVIIAAVGLLIVFVALVLISVFIATLPRVLVLFGHLWPEVEEHHGLEHVEVEAEDDLALWAAIGFVLHSEFQRQIHGKAGSDQSS